MYIIDTKHVSRSGLNEAYIPHVCSPSTEKCKNVILKTC